METHETSHNITPLTARQRMAAQMLADGQTMVKIAKALKIRRETVSRWNRRPEFQAEYARVIEENKKNYLKIREQMRDNLQHEVTHLLNEAIGTINCRLNHTYDTLSDRAAFALDVLKFLKADRLWAPGSPAQDGNK